MRREIKNCPFCGSNRIKLRRKNRTIIKGIEKRNTFCYCTVCDSRGTRVLYEDFEHHIDAENKAIEMWNRRYNENN